MKRNCYLISLLFVISMCCTVCTYAQAGKKLPNIVFILADDLGLGDLTSFNKDAQIPTPNLSKLASQGLMCTNAHSPSAVCTPSRYGILTGRYAFRSSLKKGVLGGYSPALIEESRFTMADLAKNAGYATAIIGKWHLGLDFKPIDPSKPAIDRTDLSNVDFNAPVLQGPNNLGFDFSYILPASLDMSPYMYLENGKCTDYPLVPEEDHNTGRGIFWRGGYKSKSFKIEQTLDHFTDKARQYIQQASKDRDHPFFLYLTLTAPHTPWLPASTFKNKSNAGVYGDFVAHTDDAVGRILRCLDSLHLTDNTLVIFSSDNGADWKKKDMAEFPKHKANYIFRGEKSDIWDGGHHIPLILRWPKQIPAKRSTNELICLSDMMATMAHLTHQQLPQGAGPDSYDCWPLFNGTGKTSRPSIIHHSNEGMFAIRKGKWKYIDGQGSGGWSPKDPNDHAPGQLYDMSTDEQETTNLYDKYPDIVKELKALLEQQKSQGYSVGQPVAQINASKKPNIIILLADDLGWGDVGYHGSNVRTPNIDQLAKEGIELNRFYTAAVCSPTRAGILTGRYPDRYGLRNVIPPWSKFGIDTSEIFLPQLLAKAGYTNRAIIGKWHLGHASAAFHPLNRGFTHFYGHLNGAISYFTHEREGQLDWHNDFEPSYDKGYSTDLLTNEAIKNIKNYSKQSPFFLYIAFNAPHAPLQAKQEDLLKVGYDAGKPTFGNGDNESTLGRGNTRQQTYAAMVTNLDENIGRLLHTLDELGIAENTIVLFESDNGAETNMGGTSGTLRGKKGTEWEGGVRAPAIIRWPAAFKGGQVCNQVMGYIDVMPTLLDAAGAPSKPAHPFDGMSMLPVLTGKVTTIDRNFYLGAGAIINNEWKLVEDQLFQIATDPSEKENVRTAHSTKYNQLKTAAQPYLAIKAPVTAPAYNAGREGFVAPKEWKVLNTIQQSEH